MNAEEFERLCAKADELFEQERFAEAEATYWKAVPDCYRPGTKNPGHADAFFDVRLWKFYLDGKFHEFIKFAGSIPSTTRIGDRENLADLCADIGETLLARDKLEEAAHMFKLAVALWPAKANYHLGLSMALEPLGDPLSKMAARCHQALLEQG